MQNGRQEQFSFRLRTGGKGLWSAFHQQKRLAEKEINRVSYNVTKPKFDLREWAPGREKMGKGITLNEEEAKELCRILFQYFKKTG